MNILLVEPEYYTRYPPLGLLKIASMQKFQQNRVFFHRGNRPALEAPLKIYITSLFTYAWKPVHETAEYYRNLYPNAEIVLGGIYATLMNEHANLACIDTLYKGLCSEAEAFKPDYSLIPGWKTNILFATRGCIRKCPFCAVPRIEGPMRVNDGNIKNKVNTNFNRIILWDNNILAAPNWSNLVSELTELNFHVDFNQGLDIRLMKPKMINSLKKIKLNPIRMAYDNIQEKAALRTTIPALDAAGFDRRQMIVYTLYNFNDTPEDFWQRVVDLLSWGVVSYPMRYEPLNTLVKNKYISPYWTSEQLEMVAKARRVIGAGGAFPPYSALLNKFRNARSFEDAFSLRPKPGKSWNIKEIAGMTENPTEGIEGIRAAYREIFSDPVRLLQQTRCESCGRLLKPEEYAFAFQDYTGRYIGYSCYDCHPDKETVNSKWKLLINKQHG
jgi:hypothetical protein